MKKLVSWILASVFAVSAAIALSACSKQERITVAIPNDTTNEARALLLLQENGLITLKEGAGITATIRDIDSNPQNITCLLYTAHPAGTAVSLTTRRRSPRAHK